MDKYTTIVKEIRREMIMEIKTLFDDKENLPTNIKMIKELTVVLKDLDKIFERGEEESAQERLEDDRDLFYKKIRDRSIIPFGNNKDKNNE